MSDSLKQLYTDRIAVFSTSLAKVQAQDRLTAWLRAMVFLSALILVILFAKSSTVAGIMIPVALLFVFIYLVQRSSGLRIKIHHLEHLIRVNENEIAALSGDLKPFKSGSEYTDYHHAFSYDLDIFGDHSIYRMLERTGTVPGKELLARELMEVQTDRSRIIQRQLAVKELAGKLDWRQEFLATACQIDFEKDETVELKNWLKRRDAFAGNRLYPMLFVLIPLISVAVPLLIAFAGVSAYVALYYFLPLALVAFHSKRILNEQNRIGRFVKLFRKYAGLLTLLEKEKFTSGFLLEKQETLKRDDVAASTIVNRLAGILWGLETRNNLVMAFILNAFLLWDIRYMVTLEKWRSRYGDAFDKWLEVIACTEVLNSLANFAFNRSDVVYPELSDREVYLHLQQCGHPLIDPAERVDNDLLFDGEGQIKIITGANMAGKSTLLRTVGVNLVLAMMGAPVCAAGFVFAPIRIRTSVRTNDSLGDHASYFYAELVRLGEIMDDLKQYGSVFVIVDEMLRGTNSRDKHRGSVGIIQQLIRLGASGLVATHDIQLGKLIEEYPKNIENKCFEVDIRDDQLHFDYLLRDGISQNLNATFLMEQMGIIQKNTITDE